MENLFIKLLDHRGRIIWASDPASEVLDRRLPEFAVDEDRVSAEARLADTVIRGQRVSFTSRWNTPRLGVIWCRTDLYPVECSGVAAVAVHQVLPECFQEMTAQDVEILRLLAADHGVNEIALLLDRSPSTIDCRVRSLKTRLNQKTLHGLISAAYRGCVLPLVLSAEQGPRLTEEAG